MDVSASMDDAGKSPSPSFLVIDLLPRVLHHWHRLELDVRDLAVNLLDAAHVLVLHDVARLRIDHDRAARAAIALPTLQQLHRLVRIDLALLRDDDVEDRGHAVISADDLEGRLFSWSIFRLVRLDEGLIRRPL